MFFRDADGIMHVHCRDCHHPNAVEELTTWRECQGCGQKQTISWYLSRAADLLIRQEVDIQMLKEDLYRASSKRSSPQQVAKLEKRIRTLERQLDEIQGNATS